MSRPQSSMSLVVIIYIAIHLRMIAYCAKKWFFLELPHRSNTEATSDGYAGGRYWCKVHRHHTQVWPPVHRTRDLDFLIQTLGEMEITHLMGSQNQTTWRFNHPGFQFYQMAQSKQEMMGSGEEIHVYGGSIEMEDSPSRAGSPKQWNSLLFLHSAMV